MESMKVINAWRSRDLAGFVSAIIEEAQPTSVAQEGKREVTVLITDVDMRVCSSEELERKIKLFGIDLRQPVETVRVFAPPGYEYSQWVTEPKVAADLAMLQMEWLA